MRSTPVLFLHSSMSSGQQWNALRESLDLPSVAPDISGYGTALMPINKRSEHQLAFELAELADQVPDQPFHLVGHSYGAANALRLARLQPEKVISLTLFEPVAFHLLSKDDPQQQSVHALSQKIENFIDQHDPASAAACF
ncbi:alpha/beta fold hydrolase, partial [Oceanospirillum sp. HFRX-1_2]